ncbi:MAG: hypothetical protein AB1411_03550 [Nitrospirota bacterium]
MTLDPQLLAEFRAKLAQARDADPAAWEASRRLVSQPMVQATLTRLAEAVRTSSLAAPLRDALLQGLSQGQADRIQSLSGDALKLMTGLPPTKAIRSLCLLFGLTGDRTAPGQPPLAPDLVEAFVRSHRNPFDLLLETEQPSLLDLGAGDLSFVEELTGQYLPRLHESGRSLTVHGIDRLQPGSKLGGVLQADPGRLARLRHEGARGPQFQFWHGQDLFDLGRLKKLLPRYTIVTCHAPPTPTVAFEPTRLAPSVIDAHLRATKGRFRKVRVEGEEALEVLHGGRALLFPPWKFEIRGPLALLEVLARRGTLGVLSAVDTEVFWELLAQLLEDQQVRPRDVIFTQAILPQVFGVVYERLTALPVGGSVSLGELAPLRQALPSVLDGPKGRPFRFRYVEIRRGAVFAGLPASRTARLFTDMKEEAPPWMLILVPE